MSSTPENTEDEVPFASVIGSNNVFHGSLIILGNPTKHGISHCIIGDNNTFNGSVILGDRSEPDELIEGSPFRVDAQ